MLSEKPQIVVSTFENLPEEIRAIHDYESIREAMQEGSIVALSLSIKDGQYGECTHEGHEKAAIICVPASVLGIPRIGNIITRQAAVCNLYFSGELDEFRSLKTITEQYSDLLGPDAMELVFERLPEALTDIKAYAADIGAFKLTSNLDYTEYCCGMLNMQIMLLNMAIEITIDKQFRDLNLMLLDIKARLIDGENVENINNRLSAASVLSRSDNPRMRIYPDITQGRFEEIFGKLNGR